MKAHFRNRRARSGSTHLATVPPPPDSSDHSPAMAKYANSILYRSPIPSAAGLPIYILNAAALPDSKEVDYDTLLPYVLARLPGEDDLVNGQEYEVIFFAGSGGGELSGNNKKAKPQWGWFFQAYHVLSRAMRKRIQKLYIVHEKTWVRLLVEAFSTIVSPKFRRKIVHSSTITALALHLPIEDILIPPSAFLQDRKLDSAIHAPYASGQRAFSAPTPLPRNSSGGTRFPRVLRETTSFILLPSNIVTEGLFRIPGHAKLKDVVREAYDRGQKFIIWKDNNGSLFPVPSYPKAINIEEVVKDVDPNDAYNVHLAAGLVKQWYSNLRVPLVSNNAYLELNKLFGATNVVPTVNQLKDLLDPRSAWSPLTIQAREIMTRHLLPLLACVTVHEDKNKMTADNLAMCFAPALLRGADSLEEVKMASLMRRVIAQAVTTWPEVRAACGIQETAFERELQAPEKIEDYEDPLNALETSDVHENDSRQTLVSPDGVAPEGSLTEQKVGIIVSPITQAGSISARSTVQPVIDSSPEVLDDDDDVGLEGMPSLANPGDWDVPPPTAHQIGPARNTENDIPARTALPPALPPRNAVSVPEPAAVAGGLQAPTLPPRAGNTTSDPSDSSGSRSASGGTSSSAATAVRRKPAPQVTTQLPPRYETTVSESPSSYSGPADGFREGRRGDWSFDAEHGG